MTVNDVSIDADYLRAASAVATKPNFPAYARALRAAGLAAADTPLAVLEASAEEAYREGRRRATELDGGQLREVVRLLSSEPEVPGAALPLIMAGLLADDGSLLGSGGVDVPHQVAEAIRDHATGALETWYLPLPAQTAVWGAGDGHDLSSTVSVPVVRMGDTLLVGAGKGGVAGPRVVVASEFSDRFASGPAHQWRKDGAGVPAHAIGVLRPHDAPWSDDPGREAVPRTLVAASLFGPKGVGAAAECDVVVVIGRMGSRSMLRTIEAKGTPWQGELARSLGAGIAFADPTFPDARAVERRFQEVPYVALPPFDETNRASETLPTPGAPDAWPWTPGYDGGVGQGRLTH